jgi:Undecaprenyl-phosphate galactose phosphotransferase WbaP
MSSATTLQPTSTRAEITPLIHNIHRPTLSALLVFASDLVVLGVILGLASLAIPWVMSEAAIVTALLILYCSAGLYPGICVCPIDEIKRVSIANASAFSLISLMLIGTRARLHAQLICFSAAVTISVGLVAMRSLVRRIGSSFAWWGHPVALFGDGEAVISALRKLKDEPRLGLRPVALVSDQIPARELHGVTVCQIRHLDRIANCGVKHALVAAPELSQSEFAALMERTGSVFPDLIVIPNTHLAWKIGSHTRDVMRGVLGVQVRNNLLRRESRIAKRCIDLLVCSIAAPIAIPVMIALSVAIALETGFPVFYSQERLGCDDCTFRIWKFRTMVRNATEVLDRTLKMNPALRKEWEENQKLRDDPRITRVGRLLRKTSLDELPQLWNVMKGEMSLVGPRPIVREEIAKYNECYAMYRATTPGLTGLWQVSGRNRTTYAERVAFDAYYVRNWSVWMDIYLLARTITVVLTGDGAY